MLNILAILRTLRTILGSFSRHLARPGAYLAHLGAILANLGVILAHLCGSLGRLVAYMLHLGAILAYLGAILTHLGAILGRLGGILASQKPPKIAPRGLQDASQDEVQHRAQFGSVRGAKNVENVERGASKKPVLASEREARLYLASPRIVRKSGDTLCVQLFPRNTY